MEGKYINYNWKKEMNFKEEFQVDNRVSEPFERMNVLYPRRGYRGIVKQS